MLQMQLNLENTGLRLRFCQTTPHLGGRSKKIKKQFLEVYCVEAFLLALVFRAILFQYFCPTDCATSHEVVFVTGRKSSGF